MQVREGLRRHGNTRFCGVKRGRREHEEARNKKTSISRHSRVSAVVTKQQRPRTLVALVNSNHSCASTFGFANRAQDPLATLAARLRRCSESHVAGIRQTSSAMKPSAFPEKRRFNNAVTETRVNAPRRRPGEDQSVDDVVCSN